MSVAKIFVAMNRLRHEIDEKTQSWPLEWKSTIDRLIACRIYREEREHPEWVDHGGES